MGICGGRATRAGRCRRHLEHRSALRRRRGRRADGVESDRRSTNARSVHGGCSGLVHTGRMGPPAKGARSTVAAGGTAA